MSDTEKGEDTGVRKGSERVTGSDCQLAGAPDGKTLSLSPV